MRYLLTLTIFTLAFWGCETRLQWQIDEDLILEYIAKDTIPYERHGSKLYYYIEEEGDTDKKPYYTSGVEVIYKGTLLDGTVFDSTTTPIYLPLANTITGWQYGVPLLGEGGKGKFIIPSSLGYGQSDLGAIPANSILLFDIELTKVY